MMIISNRQWLNALPARVAREKSLAAKSAKMQITQLAYLFAQANRS